MARSVSTVEEDVLTEFGSSLCCRCILYVSIRATKHDRTDRSDLPCNENVFREVSLARKCGTRCETDMPNCGNTQLMSGSS